MVVGYTLGSWHHLQLNSDSLSVVSVIEVGLSARSLRLRDHLAATQSVPLSFASKLSLNPLIKPRPLVFVQQKFKQALGLFT